MEQLISTSVAVSIREEAPRGKGLGHRVALTYTVGSLQTITSTKE